MPEKSESNAREVVKATTKSEYIFPDDPRRLREFADQAKENLRTYFSSLSMNEKRDFIEAHFFQIKEPSILLHSILGLSQEVIDHFPTLPQLVLFQADIVELFESFLSEYSPRTLEVKILESILPNLFIGSFSQEEHLIKLISPLSINPVTAWYVETAFSNIDATIKQLQHLEGETKSKIILALATLGLLYGKLDKDNPYAKYYQAVLSPYLPTNTPHILKEYIPSIEKIYLDTPRLQALKGYWHKAFVVKWMASARLGHDEKGSLSISDRQLAARQLPPDGRSTETGAVRQAQAVYAKSDSLEQREGVIQDYVRETRKVEQAELKARKQLQQYTNNLLKAYNPEHVAFLDNKDVPVRQWAFYRQKVGKIFEIFVKNAYQITRKDCTPVLIEQTLATTASLLRNTIETGRENYQLNLQELFGQDFLSISPIEQISLIVFTALTLASSRDKPENAVYLISYKLQQLLSSHHDNDPAEQPPVVKNPEFDPESYTEVIQSARTKLYSFVSEDGVLSADDPEVRAELEERMTLLKGLEKLINGSRLEEFLTNNSGEINAFALILSLSMFGLGSTVYGFITGEDNAAILHSTCSLGLGLFGTGLNSLLTYSRLPRRAGLKELRSKIKDVEILGDNFAEEINNLQQKKKLKESQVKLWITAILLVLFLISFNIRLYADLSSEEDRQETTVFGTGQGLVDTSIVPESVNPESLRSLEHRYEGRLLHLPYYFLEESGEVIGYQSESWLRINGSPYIDNERQAFTNIEYINSIDELNYEPLANQLVYQKGRIGRIIHPLDGYRIVKVFQVGGSQPEMGGTGELYYLDPNQQPNELVLVLERLPDPTINDLSGHILSYENMQGVEYDSWNDWPNKRAQALITNAELINDPDLQQLHSDMILEADALYQQLANGEINEPQIRKDWSELATRSASEFAQYVNTHRYYSLRFNSNGVTGPHATLHSVAQDPKQGYYCMVGNKAFQAFMEGIGVAVLTKPGVHIRNYDHELVSRIGHMNSAVLLPNGEILFTDMTPARPMPGEDLSALQEVPPPPSRKEEILQRVGILAGLVAATGVVYVGQKELRRRLKKRKFEEKVEGDLPEDSDEQLRVLGSIEHVLMYVIEVANEERWQKFSASGFYKTKEELYRALAFDITHLVTSDNVVSHSVPDLSFWIDKLRKSRKVEYEETELLPKEEKKSAIEGLKLIRRYIVEAVKIKKDELLLEKIRLIDEENLLKQQAGLMNVRANQQSPTTSIQLENQSQDLQRQLESLQRSKQILDIKVNRLTHIDSCSSIIRRILEETR